MKVTAPFRMSLACLPRHRAVAYLLLVRRRELILPTSAGMQRERKKIPRTMKTQITIGWCAATLLIIAVVGGHYGIAQTPTLQTIAKIPNDYGDRVGISGSRCG